MKKIIPLLIFVFSLLVFEESHVAVALSCAPPKPIQEEYKDSAIVFLGTALNSNSESLKVNFEVKTLWQGSLDRIGEGIQISNMWKDIEAGKDYIMFVNDRDERLEANLCGNSMLSSSSMLQHINDELGTGRSIEQPVVDKKNPEEQADEMIIIEDKTLWLTGGIIILLGGLLAALVYYKKKKS